MHGRERGSSLDRRTLLGQLVGLASLIWAGSPLLTLGCSRSAPACYDPELFSTPERAMRESRHYVDASPEGEAKRCSGCAFFEPAASSSCGQCRILAGPVSDEGLCDAWSARTSG